MSQHAIRNSILLALIALTGLLTVQIVWFQRAYDLKKHQFSERVNLALRQTAHELLTLAGDQKSRIPPVQQLAGNEWRIQLERNFEYDSLPALLHQAIDNQHIESNYNVAIIDCYNMQLILGYDANLVLAGDEVPCSGREQTASCYNLTVTFPNQRASLLQEMGFWIFSALACLLVLAYFGYSLYILLKEKRLSQMKEDFISNMTHELKTPIANIAIASEVLKNPMNQFSAAKMQSYAGIIHSESERLREQVERVLQIAYLEENKLDLKLEPFNLNDLIEDILVSFSVRVQHRNGKLSFQANANNASVEADKFHLSNVIYSLLDNADKYSPMVPEIFIITEDTPQGIRLTIADRGMGILKEFQQHIFDKFYRIPTGDVHNVNGFGLGLSYAKMIIEAHGGNISVESQAQAGSRFYILMKY